LQTIPEFKLIAGSTLRRLCKEFRVKTCIKGHVLYEQGSPIDELYFVKEGQFRIEQDIAVPREVGGVMK